MKFIFSILLLFNLSFADIITSPAFMFMPNNIFYHSTHDQSEDKECLDDHDEHEQQLSESDKIMIVLTGICAGITILMCWNV